MLKRYRYRAYPTPAQIAPINQVFGCTRVVFNDALALCKAEYEATGKKPSSAELSKRLTASKKTKERAWLSEVSYAPLQQSLRDLDTAFNNFFASHSGKRKGKKVSPPKFKSKSNVQKARFTTSAAFKVFETTHGVGFVRLPKIGKVRFTLSRPLPSSPTSVTLIREADGRHYVSFVVDVPEKKFSPAKDEAVGLDLGLTHLAITVDTNGQVTKFDNPRWLRTKERKLGKLQRQLSRKTRGSARYKKQQKRIAVAHRKVRETRTHYLHQVANKVVDESQIIALESLSVEGLKRTRLGKSVSDAGWGKLTRLIAEKASERGRTVVTADRWAPTTQTCSICGAAGGKKALSIRAWQCQECKTWLDRDANAAVNIMLAAGLAESLNGRGGNVRQVLASAVTGEAPTHRELTPSGC